MRGAAKDQAEKKDGNVLQKQAEEKIKIAKNLLSQNIDKSLKQKKEYL